MTPVPTVQGVVESSPAQFPRGLRLRARAYKSHRAKIVHHPAAIEPFSFPRYWKMLNSTRELITLWASSSPSLLAFCFSHLIIAVLLLGGRGCAPAINGRAGERVTVDGEVETMDAAQVQGGQKNRGGQEDPVTALNISGGGSAPDLNGRAEGCAVEVGEVGTDAFQLQASEKNSGGEEGSITADTLQEKRGDQEEDELMMRAEGRVHSEDEHNLEDFRGKEEIRGNDFCEIF